MHHESLGSKIRAMWSVSFFEVMVCLIAFFVFAGCAGWTYINSDGLAQMIVSEQTQKVENIDGYIYAYEFINNNPLVATATTFALWASLGLILSNIAYYLYASERSVAELFRILRRGGPQSKALLSETGTKVGLRVAGIVSLLIGATIFVRFAVPWVSVVLDGSLMSDVPKYLLSVAGVWVLFSLYGHFNIVMLRFITLRDHLR